MLLSAVFALLFAAPATPSTPLLPLREPTVSKTQICFSYAGDLWIVDRAGGDARRLTTDVGVESDPQFSPDGTWIAFTGEYEGNDDVYVIPAEGGMPKRLTTHPSGDQVVGWTRDGKRVLFRSSRNSFSHFDRLFTVPVEGGLPEELPLPNAVEGSFSPDGSHVAYVPFSNFIGTTQHVRALKHYRGGTASPVWIAKLSDSSVEKLPRLDSNDSHPMWIGDKVYFLSDRNGPVALWAYDPKTKEVHPAATSDGQDIKSASAGPDVIAWEELGSIHLFDPATGKQHAVDVRVSGDFPAARPHFESVAGNIQSAGISPTGQRAVFEAHGEILTVPADKGDVRNLTHSPAVADRDPAWSPDGKWIAYFSDESGEYQLVLESQDGLTEKKKIDLGESTFFYMGGWSPDSKRIVFSDKKLNLWEIAIADGKPVKIDDTTYDEGTFSPVWSPDSKWIAYTKQLQSGYHAIELWSVDERKPHQVTDGMSDAASPAFDRNGKFLYFIASTDDGPTVAASMGAFKVPTTRAGYVVVLRKDLKSPLAPQSDEETVKGATASASAEDVDDCKDDAGAAKGDDAKKSDDKKKDKDKDAAKTDATPVKIDFDGIDQRILGLPIPARNYVDLVTGKTHQLFLLEGPAYEDGTQAHDTLHKFDVCTRKTEKLLDDVGGFAISADGEKALYEQLAPRDPNVAGGEGGGSGHWMIRAVASLGKPAEGGKDGSLKLDGMEIQVDPKAQWAQIFKESVRIERDFFYDPNFHGADLKTLAAAYQPYVDGVMSRDDLTYVLADMFGEITAQHLYLYGGERPEPQHVRGGLLGCDWKVENGRYRIAKIYRGENWNPSLRAPLTEPGVDVHEGDYVLAVEGKPVTGADEIYSFFQETAGKTVQLQVSADPSGKGARAVSVVPIPDERGLRLRDWMEQNRRFVDEKSGGKLAYVYLPDTAVGGFTNFNRYWFPQTDKQGAVVDERFNGGGWIADYVIDWMSRPRLLTAMTREGRDTDVPFNIFGPKVMLINEAAGSGGDALPWMFRQQKLGPLVGTRTWGGIIGIGGYPSLIDGGAITAPRWGCFNPVSGEFDIENKGVTPDVEVDLDPAAWRQGRDPQLEKGVEVALQRLKDSPPPVVKRPKYPVYDWKVVRARAAAGDTTSPAGGGAGGGGGK